MEGKKNNIKNKIIIVVILIIILVFSSPLILNSLIIKSGINEYSNIAKEYVYDRYGLNYYTVILRSNSDEESYQDSSLRSE